MVVLILKTLLLVNPIEFKSTLFLVLLDHGAAKSDILFGSLMGLITPPIRLLLDFFLFNWLDVLLDHRGDMLRISVVLKVDGHGRVIILLGRTVLRRVVSLRVLASAVAVADILSLIFSVIFHFGLIVTDSSMCRFSVSIPFVVFRIPSLGVTLFANFFLSPLRIAIFFPLLLLTSISSERHVVSVVVMFVMVLGAVMALMVFPLVIGVIHLSSSSFRLKSTLFIKFSSSLFLFDFKLL